MVMRQEATFENSQRSAIATILGESVSESQRKAIHSRT